MWDTLLNTRSRGRSGVPAIRLRCRSAIRVRRSLVVLIFMSVSRCQWAVISPVSSLDDWKLVTGNLFCPCLSCLLLQHFAGIPHSLLLVRVRLSQSANVGGDLSHCLTIDSGDGNVRLLVDGDVDPRRNIEHDR